VDALPAACRRLNLANGATAVLAVGQVATQRESLSTRAERLADAIASKECLVAVLAGTAGCSARREASTTWQRHRRRSTR